MSTLPRSFYHRSTLLVARALLGQDLFHRDHQGEVRAGRIVETEAYLGPNDGASHSRFAKRYGDVWHPTPRTRLLFGPVGYAYVYLIYGIHHCLNVVAHEEGEVGAVLVRAVEPLTPWGNGSGPGRLCKGLGIDQHDNGLDVTEGSVGCLWIQQGVLVSEQSVVTSPRIGVAYAGIHAEHLYRFFVKANAWVS